jgi:hypothetical protein
MQRATILVRSLRCCLQIVDVNFRTSDNKLRKTGGVDGGGGKSVHQLLSYGMTQHKNPFCLITYKDVKTCGKGVKGITREFHSYLQLTAETLRTDTFEHLASYTRNA